MRWVKHVVRERIVPKMSAVPDLSVITGSVQIIQDSVTRVVRRMEDHVAEMGIVALGIAIRQKVNVGRLVHGIVKVTVPRLILIRMEFLIVVVKILVVNLPVRFMGLLVLG